MTTDLAVREDHQIDATTLLKVISGGDAAGLNDKEKLMVYKARCEAAGLDYRAQPFQYIKLQGKEVLYCLKAGTDQLAAKHGVVVEIISQVTENGVRTVTVRAKARDGRQTDEIGCVSVGNATGDILCNINMKAVTKAKRRAILSICGLGMLDETELETIKESSAPPALPLPLKRSEKEALRKAANAPNPAVGAVTVALAPIQPPAATVEVLNAALDLPSTPQEPLVVPDTDEEWVKVIEVSEKPTKKGGKSYGIKVFSPKEPEPFYVNTFSDTMADDARMAKGKDEEVKITRKPREYQGKTYWDLVTLEPMPF